MFVCLGLSSRFADNKVKSAFRGILSGRALNLKCAKI